MSHFIQTHIHNHIGFITLDRPKALNSLSLEMIRNITQTLLDWKNVDDVHAVFIHSSHERAFCAGGDIRFFYEVGTKTPTGDSALLEDFFTEEYTLNYLIHQYPKPYISLLDGVVMGGGMGIAQASSENRLRIVTERTKMAMPEVNIGLFPDVGGSYFLSRCPGKIGTYLALTGEVIGAADAIYADLADVYLPGEKVSTFIDFIKRNNEPDVRLSVRKFIEPFQSQVPAGQLAQHRVSIDQYFSHNTVAAICAALHADSAPLAQRTYQIIQTRSPLLMCVTLEQLQRGQHLSIADCLRMERTMVRHCFKHGEVLEGVRALAIDKDMRPQWQPAHLAEVTTEQIQSFFAAVWPDYAHPLRGLE